MDGLIPELENIAEILFNKGYNSLGNATRKAIEKLKGQEPKKPIYDRPFIRCPRCKNSITVIQKYCDECGQAIDWKGK